MGYVVGVFALLAVYACWQFFWKDVAFVPYLTTRLPESAPKIKFWYYVGAILLAFGGILSVIFPPLSILIGVFVASLWLTSPNGRVWAKKVLGLS